jgi:hypothetical protein
MTTGRTAAVHAKAADLMQDQRAAFAYLESRDWKQAISTWRKARRTPRGTTQPRTSSMTKEQQNDQLSQLSRTTPSDST